MFPARQDRRRSQGSLPGTSHKIRNVIDTIASKAVLILGRFTTERKAVLDALRDELRKRDYLSILFDFDKKPPGAADCLRSRSET